MQAEPVARHGVPWRWALRICGVWAGGLTTMLALVAALNPPSVTRAILGMAAGLGILWIGLGGAFELVLREPARRAARPFTRVWPVAFVVGATTLALIEEAIATGMTNTAPLWGTTWQQAHITASNNYFEVVAFHSVVVFIPMFIAWAWLLHRYTFHPNAVLLLFGCNGVIGETLSFGAQNLLMFGFWVYVYGLIVYLPAYAFAPLQRGRNAGKVAHLLALTLPTLASVPVALLVLALHH